MRKNVKKFSLKKLSFLLHLKNFFYCLVFIIINYKYLWWKWYLTGQCPTRESSQPWLILYCATIFVSHSHQQDVQFLHISDKSIENSARIAHFFMLRCNDNSINKYYTNQRRNGRDIVIFTNLYCTIVNGALLLLIFILLKEVSNLIILHFGNCQG